MSAALHQLHVDHSERQSALLGALQRAGTFDVQMVRLVTGDFTADAAKLTEVPGLGPKKAARIRDLVG